MPFQNFNSYTVEVLGRISNFSLLGMGMWLLIHAEIKANPC